MQQLRICEYEFREAFERDTTFRDIWPRSFIWIEGAGVITSVYDEDKHANLSGGAAMAKINKKDRKEIEEFPEDFLLIPGHDHREHHDLLRDFLDTVWTDDPVARDNAHLAYQSSIGGWMKRADQKAIDAYQTYFKECNRKKAEAFLRRKGIGPIWSRPKTQICQPEGFVKLRS